MNWEHSVSIAAAVAGVVLFAFGIGVSLYPVSSRVFRKKERFTLQGLSDSPVFSAITRWITDGGTNGVYRISRKLLYNAEVAMEVQTLYFYKLVSFLAAALVLLTVRYTNLDVMKVSIISKSAVEFNLFESVNSKDYQHN